MPRPLACLLLVLLSLASGCGPAPRGAREVPPDPPAAGPEAPAGPTQTIPMH